MKSKKLHLPWWQLYATAVIGCLILFGENALKLSVSEHHLVLIFTMVLMFWLMQQWFKDHRYSMARSQVIHIHTVTPASTETRDDIPGF